MTAMIDRTQLYAAILQVMTQIGYIVKDGKVEFGTTKYKYAGEAALIKQLRPAMIEAGLIMPPIHSEAQVNGKMTTVTVTYQLTHVPSGQCMPICVVGQGADTNDKAAPKAMTGALKYALRQAFMLETGDDPDRDASGKTDEQVANAAKADARKARIASTPYSLKQINDCLTALKKKKTDLLKVSDAEFTKAIKWVKGTKGQTAMNDFIGIDPQGSTDRASEAMGEE